MESNEFQSRLERAQSLDAELHVRADDPVVCEIDHGENTYTIVPNTAYCGCPDARHRGFACKHILAVLTGSVETPAAVSETLADAVQQEADERLDDLEERLDAIAQDREKATVWVDASCLAPDVDLAESEATRIGDDGEPRARMESLQKNGDTTEPDTGTLGDAMVDNAGDGGLGRVVSSVTTE